MREIGVVGYGFLSCWLRLSCLLVMVFLAVGCGLLVCWLWFSCLLVVVFLLLVVVLCHFG